MRIKVFTCAMAGYVLLNIACRSNKGNADPAQFKGLYTLTPTQRSFKNCTNGQEYWVADSTKELEARYWKVVAANKTDKPVYIEVDGQVVPSNTEDADEAYTNTLIVRKVILITKDVPAGQCN